MGSSLSEKSSELEFGGNSYTQLSSEEQSSIYDEILKRRHSIDILRMERHVLENEDLPSSIAKKPGLGLEDFAAAANRYSSIERRKVVAVDCEWGRAESRRSELLSISVIDVLSGEILINSLVAPSQPMMKWREEVHGITQQKIDAAMEKHQCIQGWKEARAKLFEHIDGDTILVGFTIRVDLELLRLFHTTIVDSQVLATSAVFAKQWGKKPRPKWPMAKVCRDFLDITSFNQLAATECGTDASFENALIAREIVLQCIRRPKDFDEWAKQSRTEFWKPHNEKNALHASNDTKKAKKEKKAKKAKNTAVSDTSSEKQTNAGSMLDTNDEGTKTFGQGYEAGYQAAYQAAFKSGFQIGYEQGLQDANQQANRAMASKPDQSPEKDQQNHQEPAHYSEEEQSFDDEIGGSSQIGSDYDGWSPT